MDIIFFTLATHIYLMLKDEWKRYIRCCQVAKKTGLMFVRVRHQQSALTKTYINREKLFSNRKKLWNSKLIRKLLLTVNMTILKEFIPKI